MVEVLIIKSLRLSEFLGSTKATILVSQIGLVDRFQFEPVKNQTGSIRTGRILSKF